MNGVMIQIYSTEQPEQFCDNIVKIWKCILQPSSFMLDNIGSEKKSSFTQNICITSLASS